MISCNIQEVEQSYEMLKKKLQNVFTVQVGPCSWIESRKIWVILDSFRVIYPLAKKEMELKIRDMCNLLVKEKTKWQWQGCIIYLISFHLRQWFVFVIGACTNLSLLLQLNSTFSFIVRETGWRWKQKETWRVDLIGFFNISIGFGLHWESKIVLRDTSGGSVLDLSW